jgi:hypothetical protein
MHITLRQLEVFAEVLKSGSTTQASQMLALSQSAVSAALTDLEGQLSVQLFDRVGKRLVVNEHGRLLYPVRWRCWSRRRKLNNCFVKKTAQFASTPAVRLAITSCRKSLPTIDEIFLSCRWI